MELQNLGWKRELENLNNREHAEMKERDDIIIGNLQ